MRRYRLAALLAFLLLVAGACMANSTPAPDLEATVQAAVQATLDAHQNASAHQNAPAQPTDTPAPDMKATLVAAVEATLTAHQDASAQLTRAPSTDVQVASDSERPHRSYPAPTGSPGFRKYYQKRCYPGCHYDASEGTPTPQAAHP